MMEAFLFGVFSLIAMFSSVAVVVVANPVHSVLGLIVAFVSSCGLMMMLQVEFMSLVFIVVYVGAIAVLFLFVVMMLNLGDRKESSWEETVFMLNLFLGLGAVQMVLASYFYSSLVGELDQMGSSNYLVWMELVDSLTTLSTLGQVLYTHYFLYLLMAGFVLLVARVGAIVLTLKVRTFALSKRQQVFQQLSRDADRAIMLVRSHRVA